MHSCTCNNKCFNKTYSYAQQQLEWEVGTLNSIVSAFNKFNYNRVPCAIAKALRHFYYYSVHTLSPLQTYGNGHAQQPSKDKAISQPSRQPDSTHDLTTKFI